LVSDRKYFAILWCCLLLPVFLFSGRCPALARQSLPDPTRPVRAFSPAVPAKAKPSRRWQLTSTLVGPNRRGAVINGQVVAVGQRISGALLEQVEPGQARLRQGKKVIRLQVPSASVKAPVGQPQP
jgi:hypothetical protein